MTRTRNEIEKTGTERRRSRAREDRLALLEWIASLGAVTAEAVASRDGMSPAAARGRLRVAVAEGLLATARPLADRPTLYALTSRGARTLARKGLAPCQVRPGNAQHLMACASAAVGLESCYPDHLVWGERELRLQEREHGARLASAMLGWDVAKPLLHRPDIVLWPRSRGALPVAVEVELTVKAQRRLEAICRAWARCELVAGVLYLVTPAVERPLCRAIERAGAGDRVVSVPLASLPEPISSSIPSCA